MKPVIREIPIKGIVQKALMEVLQPTRILYKPITVEPIKKHKNDRR